MTELSEQTFEGKLLPRHLKMFRDMYSDRIELRHWKFEPPSMRQRNLQIDM